ncbi:MAG: CPBP family intramembrane metalloprotease [Phycisphaeraceae bacterium]|nr:CPBP family intramembrane metalloprotease [Phycisphaeraceae bacterium]
MFEVRAALLTDGLFAIVSLIALWCVRRDVGPMLRPPRERRWLAYGVGLSLVTYMLATLLASVWTAMFGQDDTHYYTDAFMAADLPMGLAIALCFVSVAVFPAVSEEIGFRGVIASALRRTLDRREATLVTALLFASIHINPFMFVNLFLMGLVLAFLVARCGSLLPGIALHFCHNAFCVLHELVPGFPG